MEYGGFLPIELDIKEEYFSKYYPDVIKLNSGRSALKYILLESKLKKIYIPYYICNTIVDIIKELNIEFEFYRINKNLLPINVELGSGEYILIVNYYGIINKETINSLKNIYTNVIFDNTQSFFSEPVIDSYNIYSCRKFFGVSDGAYLIKRGIEKLKIEKDYSYERAVYMLKSLELGTNKAYNLSLENEKIIGMRMLKMSCLTERIMKSINYSKIKQIRRNNFKFIHRKLSMINELIIDDSVESPLYYPLFLKKYEIRDELIKQKVYVPTMWKHILEQFEEGDIEYDLSKYLICLPIDQRYSIEDINNMLDIIINIIKNKEI